MAKVVPETGVMSRSASMLFILSSAIRSRPLKIESSRTMAATGTAIATMLTPEMMLMTEWDFGERT